VKTRQPGCHLDEESDLSLSLSFLRFALRFAKFKITKVATLPEMQ
jgi:hypothetical protein